jgi:hypothetical protein
MRFVVSVTFPTGKFDQAVADGTVGEKMGRLLEEAKPEAAYFMARDGRRGGFLVIQMNDVAEMPRLAEPWFLLFDAEVQFWPAMTPADLQKADLASIGRKWK